MEFPSTMSEHACGLERIIVTSRKLLSRISDRLSGSKLFSMLRHNWYPVVLNLFLLPLLCAIVGVTGFVFNISLTKWHVGIVLLVCLLLFFVLSNRNVLKTLALFGVFLAVLFGLILLFSIPTHDYWDSMAYHRPGALLMAYGWNPLRHYENLQAVDVEYRSCLDDLRAETVIASFPKAQWIFNALTYLVTGNINVGSYSCALFAIASVFISFWSLGVLFNLSVFERLLATLVIAGNTIAIGEMFDGMIDGLMASLLTILIFSFAGYLKTRDIRFAPFIAGSIPFMANIKQTGVAYAVIVLVVFSLPLAFQAWRNSIRLDRRFIAAISASLLAAVILGINPYIYNTIEHGSPGYPYLGKDGSGDSIFTQFIKPENAVLHGTNSVQRFVTSHLVSQPRSFFGADSDKVIVKPSEVLFGGYEGPIAIFELGGFGPLFSIALAVSLTLMLFVSQRTSWLMIAAILGTAFFMPHNYFARYAPQLWLLPPVVLCAIRSQSRESRIFYVRSGLLFLLVFSVLLLGCIKTLKSTYDIVKFSTKEDIHALRLVRQNPHLLIELKDHWNFSFYQKRYLHDCLIDTPRYRDFSKNDCRDLAVCGSVKLATVYYNPANENAEGKIRIVHPAEESLLISIADLRWRQFKKAWSFE